jgi:hypothetical protein
VTRRALGRGRLLVIVGALVTLAGLVPRWWLQERTNQPDLAGNGFAGIGLVIFLAALTLMAIVVLPFATRDGTSGLDKPLVYGALALIAIAAFLWRLFEISQVPGIGLPTQAPGLWLTGLGLLVVAWGVGTVATERPPDY